jgi:hypothetical protein
MGRAIDMEKDIDVLKAEVQKLKEILNELVQGVTGNGKKKTKKTNNKSSGGSSDGGDTGDAGSTSKG